VTRLAAESSASGSPALDHRIKVLITTRVRTELGERAVKLVAISAKTALVFAPESIGIVGHCVDLFLPAVGHDIEVLSGIERVDQVVEGYAATIRFIVADTEVRNSLNELLALLLAGDGGGSRKHPRILYDTPVTLGEGKLGRGRLEEISLSGMSVRVRDRLHNDTVLSVTVPQIRQRPPLVLVGRVVNQRLSAEGGYHTGIAFDTLGIDDRIALSALLADLMSR
jgi:hypothetical protein